MSREHEGFIGGPDEHDEAWTAFRQRLADRLAGMAEDDVLLVQLATGVDDDELGGESPYVHVTALKGEVLHAEVSSSYSLDERFMLTDEAAAQVVALGWTHPDDDQVDSIDFEADLPQGMADLLAVNTVRVLREVFGCLHPAFLEAQGLEPAPAVVPVPPQAVEQDVVMPRGAAHLQELVDAALEVLFDSPARHDEDGDLPITCGSSMVYVRVHQELPTVEVFAHLVLDVQDLARAAQEVARLNRRSPHDQFLLRNGFIEMRTAVLAVPFCAEQLRNVVQRFCGFADQVALELAELVGGRRFLDEEAPAPVHPATEPGMVVLLELLHAGDVHPATVAGLFADDRRDLVRQIVRVRRGQQGLDGHDEEVVLDHLRGALRLVADREAGVVDSASRRRRTLPSRQLSLLTDGDLGQGTLETGLA
ncbi:T3SS (YopN, CesT) and YbjN peptide-binding chaperone 1 [Nocardioides taihuensis]|uniref:YbjN domain-containing protein n=1 Tax=Nocardioides taihuensis TaxID=1835606 RepID=A0ABW0BKV1_9ACTN